MIVYLYDCDACNTQHDVSAPMGEAPESIECPLCHEPMRRNFKSYSSMTLHIDKGWQNVDWKGRKPERQPD